MNRVEPLIRTAAVTVERFDHAPGVAHHDPDRERAPGHAVSFVEGGSFRIRTNGHWRQVGPSELIVTSPGLEFSCAHDEAFPRDVCLTVTYAEETCESARASGGLLAGPLVRPVTNRRAYLGHHLSRCAPRDLGRAEALALALLSTLTMAPRPTPAFRPSQLSWYARRLERTKELIAARHAEPLSLSDLARDAGLSVFHFARVFSELEGLSPHRYLTEVRLQEAARRLRDGASVTETCFAVGFGSLSHFITVFRRRFGATPAALKRKAWQRRL